MTEERTKKREWVKNAAIIFLSVMLVLTFFSNTFMNYSLPEVSTQYVTGGSINTKVRGSGTIMASEEYTVEAQQSRIIDTVCVKVGQTVAAGDVLFILGEGDSEELDAAKEALEDMELAYEKAILLAEKESGSSSADAVYEARENLRKAEADAEKIAKAEKDINKAEKEYNKSVEEFNKLKTHLEKLEGEEDSQEIKNLKNLLEEAEKTRDDWDAKMKELDSASDEYKTAKENFDTWDIAVKEYAKRLEEYYDIPEVNEYNELYNQYVAAEKSMNDAKTKFDAANANYEKYGSSYESALAAVNAAKKAYNDAREAFDNEQNNQEIDDKIQDIEFAEMQKDIEKQREKVAELSGGDIGNEITAKVGGTISEINIKAGETAGMGDAIAVIELSDRGYTLSVSVTSEQAKKVSIGDTAEVSTYWWGSQIKAVLKDIKNDAQSGGRNKTLVFEVSGDVEPDMNVDISIGQRSQSYEAVVLNSAVRSDSNGSFVLVLTTKNSPLGNRYSATRVDVQVIASDDMNSAVSGIGNGEYVITTASAPIEPGMLVRMAEG